MNAPAYAELHCLSNFSFGRGASSAQELFERAKALGYRALAITDEASMAGIVRAFEAANETGVALIVGSEFQLVDGPKLVLLAETLTGYQTLCRWITQGRRRARKGEYRLCRADLADYVASGEGLQALWIPGATPDAEHGAWVRTIFGSNAWLAVELHRGPDDAARLACMRELGKQLDLPLVASGDVHMHARGRRALQDTLTAIRHRSTVVEAGKRLFANGERHLRRRDVLANLYPADLIEATLAIARRCSFQLTELRYRYPKEVVPEGETPASWLRKLSEQGSRRRWPGGISEKNRQQIEAELTLIADLEYEPYFLTVYDIVRFARERGILCQGRGSSANSLVCYVLGITEVSPELVGMLMERFISRERREPPDIDIDFDSTRREEVIQYVYERYGRDRAALTAVATTYSGRSTIRDVAKALGLAPDQVDALAKTLGHWYDGVPDPERVREAGFDPDSPVLKRVLALTAQLMDFPRHLSQHPGGFVISDAPLHTLVPVENAAMPERTVIQWDKDDLDTLGLLKVDVLGIGMLGAISRCLDMLRAGGRRDLTPATIPIGDDDVYAMIQRADTVGAFQIESRAQMAMLPRLKPKCYYDLVVEVAIVRPGPIEGKMVHPYLRRRQGLEPVVYPSQALEKVLSRTLGIPLFQEQVMQIAMVAAGYTAGEADQLRRSMAAWKRRGGLEPHRERLRIGMLANGYSEEFAAQIFEQIKGFGSYGFPESHAASYALVAYNSCWLKYHEPAAFACALINTPTHMGFYTPDQLLQDARRHGIEVRPVDVRYSDWDCSLEPLVGAGMTATDGMHREKAYSSKELSGGTEMAAASDIGRGHARSYEAHGCASDASAGCAGAADRRKSILDSGNAVQPAIRIGFNQVAGLAKDAAERLMRARRQREFSSVAEMSERACLDRKALDQLADANALRGLAGHRNRARWSATGVEATLPLFAGLATPDEERVVLAPPTASESTLADYASIGLTLGAHPLKLLRKQLRSRRCRPSRELITAAHGSNVRHAGLVTLRQRPQTANGTIFVTLEDEDGSVNVVVWADLAERQRRELSGSRLLAVDGRWENVDGVQHLVAKRLHDISELLGTLQPRARNFH